MLSVKVQLFKTKFESKLKSHHLSLILLLALLGTVFGCYMVIKFMLMPPYTYEPWSQVTVVSGESATSVISRLSDRGFIKSEKLALFITKIFYKDASIQKGVYHLESPQSLDKVLYRFFVQGPHKPLVSFTVPEGSDDEEVIAIVTKALPHIKPAELRDAIRNASATGFLFPDTYYPDEKATATQVVQIMTDQFKRIYRKEFGVAVDLKNPSLDLLEHVVFAAILEGEVRRPLDMKMVAGILHNRLMEGMRLQVDVDRITYKEAGLPDKPINNPGLETLTSVFNPIASDYLFYLTGKDGRFYYAKTYEEHKRNIDRYLR